jgi:hypothetical protein
MMTTAIASFCHLHLVRERDYPAHVENAKNVYNSPVETFGVYEIVYPRLKLYLLSGFTFGFIALNTKLTNLALLPFLLIWSTIQQLKLINRYKLK